MNIDKLREAWQLDNPKVFRFKNIFGFIQFCWENKFTPNNSATVYDEKRRKNVLSKKRNMRTNLIKKESHRERDW